MSNAASRSLGTPPGPPPGKVCAHTSAPRSRADRRRDPGPQRGARRNPNAGETASVHGRVRAQVASAAATFRYYASVCETVGSEVTPARGDYLSLTVYEPMGVVAAITPWNSPLTMEAQKIAPAIAAGNAVIVKPSEVTLTAAIEVAAIAL